MPIYTLFEEKKFIEEGIPNEPQKLAATAHREILSRILTLGIAPGALVQERQLAESLGMSRTPIREALMRLSQEGWVTINARRHSEVKRLTEEDLREIMEIRHFFELRGLEAAMDASRKSPVPRAMRAIHEHMAGTCEDSLPYLLEDQRFHRVLVSAADNTRLNGFYAQVSLEVIRMGIAALKARGNAFKMVEEEHNNILKSMASGKKKDARAALCHHLDVTQAMISRSIRETW